MPRPPVDVVVPFRGDLNELAQVQRNLAQLRLTDGDSIVVVDNTPGREPVREGSLLRAAELETPAYARNRGAALGSADWIVFLDADVAPDPDMLDRYFDPLPGEHTALLAGGVRDEEVPPDGRASARYGYLRRAMDQENTFSFGEWAFVQTANAGVRRTAFEQAGGFREQLRAGEDADLTFRLQNAGWEVERREDARGTHRSRQTARAFAVQKLHHGAGAAWLDREYPGSFPARRRPGLIWWGVRTAAKGLTRAVRRRDRDAALWAVFEPLELISREFGRSMNNERSPRH